MKRWLSCLSRHRLTVCHLQTVTALFDADLRRGDSLWLTWHSSGRSNQTPGVCRCSQHQQSAVMSPWWLERLSPSGWVQSPESQSSHSSVLRSLQSKGTCTSRSCHQCRQTSVLSFPSWSASCLGSCYGEVCPIETRYQTKGDTWLLRIFRHLFRNMHDSTQCDICLIFTWHSNYIC